MPTNPTVDFGYLRELVFSLSRNVLDPSRDYLFETRLTKLLRSQGMGHLQELVDHLRHRKNPLLERAVAEAMTINETSFFRDVRPFDLLRETLLPRLIEARRHVRALRFWSAACSTGQEGYSLAMMMADPVIAAGPGALDHFAADVGALDHLGEDWTVKPEIRKVCNFRLANLCNPPLPFSLHDRFDVVFLRNVMLYLSIETRRALMANVHRLLAPDGILFLGSSEQPADPTIWTPVVAGGTCHFRPRMRS